MWRIKTSLVERQRLMFYELQSQVPVLHGPVRTWPNLLATSPGASPIQFNQIKNPIYIVLP